MKEFKQFKVMRRRRRRSPFTSQRRTSYSFTSNKRRRSNNRVGATIAMVLCAVVLVGSVCAVCVKYLSFDDTVTFDTVAADSHVIENEKNTTLILKNGDISVLSASVGEKALSSLEFESSDSDIITVDSGGRVDAKKEGVATVTATALGFKGTCEITVEKAEKAEEIDEYTTAITANADVVKKNKKDKSRNLYSVKVNRQTNVVTVYTYNKDGKYVIPVRAMVCSCGEFTDENITPTGRYNVYFKNRWHPLFGDVYGQYVTGFSGHYLFHSVPYEKTVLNALETDEFNKLGTNASQGCVRLMVSDAKWIYDNIDMNTSVEVIDKKGTADPLGKPVTVNIDSQLKWDPTDPATKNPYNEKMPQITGAEDVTIEKGGKYKPKIKAIDSCGNDISDRVKVLSNVLTDKKGTYIVTYKVTDDFKKSASVTVTVTVE